MYAIDWTGRKIIGGGMYKPLMINFQNGEVIGHAMSIDRVICWTQYVEQSKKAAVLYESDVAYEDFSEMARLW